MPLLAEIYINYRRNIWENQLTQNWGWNKAEILESCLAEAAFNLNFKQGEVSHEEYKAEGMACLISQCQTC